MTTRISDPPAEGHRVADGREEMLRTAATLDVARTVLCGGLALAVVIAATDCVFALVAGAGALAAAQGIVLVALGIAGMVRIDVAVRLLRPRGRVVALGGVYGAVGILDAGLYEHFGGVAGAIVFISALVCSARGVALCCCVCGIGYVCSLAVHGSSLAWMIGDGRYVIAGQLINFAGNGAVGLLMIALLRRFLASAPQRLAAVRAGGASLTPQLASAASGRHLGLLPAADPGALIAPLTTVEREVVALLAAGRVPKQAANDLSIALATARSRIASAKRKTGARTLDQLVAMYVEGEHAA